MVLVSNLCTLTQWYIRTCECRRSQNTTVIATPSLQTQEKMHLTDNQPSTEHFGQTNNRDAQSAMCMIRGRTKIEQFPGTCECASEDPWTTEYRGYLMSGNICVDIEMATCTDTDHPPKANTPLLKHEMLHTDISGNYRDNHVLSCVVCSI